MSLRSLPAVIAARAARAARGVRPRVARLVLGVALTGAVAGGVACARADGGQQSAAERDVAPLHAALDALTDVITYDIVSPPQASRTYAYASVAAYEVLRQGRAEYRTLAGQLHGLDPLPAPPAGELSLPLAGVHAFMTVGRQLTFSRDRMDSARTALDARFRAQGLSDATFARSVAYGDTIAQRVLAWAAQDRFLQTRGAPKFSVREEPGRWMPTPPAYMDAVEPNWGVLRPFVLDSALAVRAAPPYPFDTTATSPYWREVREVYAVGRALTDSQRAIAAHWDCNPYVMHVQGHSMYATKKISPGGHWMLIASAAARRTGADAPRTAEAFARTAIALADGFITAWAEKYRSGTIRPETVINRHLDPAWEPLLQTPPFPEYTSGHSVISNAAAPVLTALFGPAHAFVDSTELRFGLPPRRFASFQAAADEAAMSRLYAGIHFRRAIEEGARQGQAVGALHLARVRTRAGATVAQGAQGAQGAR